LSNRNLWSALAGAITALILVSAIPVMAGDGEPLMLGERNRSKAVTRVATTGGLKFVNFKVGMPALILEVVGNTPPMRVDSIGKVVNLNADMLDGMDATGFAASGHDHFVSPVIIGASALHGVGRLTEWDNVGQYVQADNDDGDGFVEGRLYAPLDLPDGAHITGLSARIQDGSATARVEVRVMRSHRQEGYPESVDDEVCWAVLMAASDDESIPGLTTVGDVTVDPPGACISGPEVPGYMSSDWSVVDNSIWTYYLQVDVVRTGGLPQHARFHSAEVSFTSP